MRIQRSLKLWLLAVFSIICLFIVFGISIQNQNRFNDTSAASASSLSGKKVLFDGDSIAAGSYALTTTSAPRWSYADYLKETYNINKTNLAIGGARFYWPDAESNCSDNTADCHIIPRHLTAAIKNNTYDYIILEGATNDLHSNYYNGDTTSYANALREYFNTVTTNPKWAHAKIGFVIVPRPDYSRKTAYRPADEKVFWKSIQSICDEYSIEYINFFKQESNDSYTVPSGFNWNFMTTKVENADDADTIVGSFDGLHPSKGAHKILGEYIANWMVNLPNYKYIVSFDSNGSSLTGATNQSVLHSKKATTPTYNIDANQHFSHWSKTKNGAAYNFNNAVNEDLTLYAIWNVNVKFYANGGKIDGDTNKTISIVGNSKVSNPGTPTRSGYVFKYWAENTNCGEAFSLDTIISRDKTLYACWDEEHTYTLSFDLGESETEIPAQSCTTTGPNCTVTIPKIYPVYSNYYFIGYADMANAKTAKYQPNDTIKLSADKVIYAIWADGDVEWQDNNKEYIKGSGNDVIIRINYPMANFVKLMLDNKEIENTEEDKYKIESGSTIITIYSAYLETIEPGEHTLQAVYDNNEIKELVLTIKASEPVVSESNTTDTDGSDSGEDNDLLAPDTGSNISKDEGNNSVVSCLLQILIISGVVAYRRYFGKNRRRKFEY